MIDNLITNLHTINREIEKCESLDSATTKLNVKDCYPKVENSFMEYAINADGGPEENYDLCITLHNPTYICMPSGFHFNLIKFLPIDKSLAIKLLVEKGEDQEDLEGYLRDDYIAYNPDDSYSYAIGVFDVEGTFLNSFVLCKGITAEWRPIN